MKLLLLDRPLDKNIILKREVEFFAPWAQPLETPEDLSPPAFEVYPNAESVYEVSLRAIEVAEELLEGLADVLPDLTGAKKGKRFWKIILGYFVITLAGIIEDIKARHAALPEKDYILGLPAFDYLPDYIPHTFGDSTRNILYNHDFRWYVMSLYLKKYYNNYERIEYQRLYPEDSNNKIKLILANLFQGGSPISKIKSYLFRHFNLYPVANNAYYDSQYIFWDSYNFEYAGIKKIRNSILLEQKLPKVKPLVLFQINREKRQKIKESFSSPYGQILSISLPVAAIEGLSYLVDLASLELKKFAKVRRIYTHGQGFSNGELQRVLLAQLADSGRKIISIQHGGGEYFANSARFMDREIADQYIAWGGGYTNNYYKLSNANLIKSLPSIYLSRLKNEACLDRKKYDVLFLILEEGRYIKWVYSALFPDLAYDYFRREEYLFSHFSQKKRVAAKVYPTRHGWWQAKWIKKKYPSIKVLSYGRFVHYALQSEIVIIDYNATGFFEMLAMNRPFLATWNRRWFKGTKFFEEFIDKLIDIGVFYEQPEDLIMSYNKIVDVGISKWWREEKRQGVIQDMARNFALTSDKAFEEWKMELCKQ